MNQPKKLIDELYTKYIIMSKKRDIDYARRFIKKHESDVVELLKIRFVESVSSNFLNKIIEMEFTHILDLLIERGVKMNAAATTCAIQKNCPVALELILRKNQYRITDVIDFRTRAIAKDAPERIQKIFNLYDDHVAIRNLKSL